ncbi:MAG: hypothetical protein JWQ09_3212 [Segetibacter sp.]|nr:hypothetical protein [Segetibacter sp.]
METLQTPFSNIQLELLRLYKSNVDDKDLLTIKKLISDYFAEKAIRQADETWEKQNWDEKKVEELLNTKMRTPYQKRRL